MERRFRVAWIFASAGHFLALAVFASNAFAIIVGFEGSIFRDVRNAPASFPFGVDPYSTGIAISPTDSRTNPDGVPRDFLTLDAAVETDSGFQTTGFSARASNTFDPTINFSLIPNEPPDPIFVPSFSALVPHQETLNAPNTWMIEILENGSASPSLTAFFVPLLFEEVPLVTEVSISGPALTPTVSWVPPADINRVRVGLIDNDTDLEIFRTGISPGSSSLPPGAMSFTFDPGTIPGPGDYTFRILAERFGGPVDDADLPPNTEFGFTRSSFFINHSVPAPEPATLALIAIGLAGLGFRRWTH